MTENTNAENVETQLRRMEIIVLRNAGKLGNYKQLKKEKKWIITIVPMLSGN
jgi:hypothetical protein